MEEVTPGALCLVIKGHSTGASVTAIEVVDTRTAETEQMNIAKKIMKIHDKYNGAVIWRVDPPITWVSISRSTGKKTEYKFPFAFAIQLLPIPPLSDPLSVKHEEETPA